MLQFHWRERQEALCAVSCCGFADGNAGRDTTIDIEHNKLDTGEIFCLGQQTTAFAAKPVHVTALMHSSSSALRPVSDLYLAAISPGGLHVIETCPGITLDAIKKQPSVLRGGACLQKSMPTSQLPLPDSLDSI